MTQDFKKLLKECRDFERKAQRQMVNLLSPFLFSICRRYESQHNSAQDLVQESLILIFNHIDDCQPEEKPFWGWCKRIAINVCLEKYRKKNLSIDSMEQAEHQQSIDPEVFNQLGVEEILLALNQLPESQKVAFNLFVIDGCSHAEIGQMLQIKEGSARTLLMRARTTLQGIINQKEYLTNEY